MLHWMAVKIVDSTNAIGRERFTFLISPAIMLDMGAPNRNKVAIGRLTIVAAIENVGAPQPTLPAAANIPSYVVYCEKKLSHFGPNIAGLAVAKMPHIAKKPTNDTIIPKYTMPLTVFAPTNARTANTTVSRTAN